MCADARQTSEEHGGAALYYSFARSAPTGPMFHVERGYQSGCFASFVAFRGVSESVGRCFCVAM